MRRLTQIPGMALAVMLTLAIASGLVFGPEARAGDGRELEGTWLMKITFVDCDTGDPLPIPGNPFPTVRTFMRGGTMVDSHAPPPIPPAVTHSTAQGIWERTGDQTFRNRYRLFAFNADGVHIETVDVTVKLSLKQGDHSKTDEILGPNTVRVFTPDGKLVGEGCARESGRRMGFEE